MRHKFQPLARHIPSFLRKRHADINLTLERIQNFKKLKQLFFQRLGYELDIINPRSLNEKIVWKKLFDRNPLLPITADKYLVRSFVSDILGKEDAEKILVPLYFVTDDPGKIEHEKLPDQFVMKPNHGSGMHLGVFDKKDFHHAFLLDKCYEWLKVNYGLFHYEWAYRNIERKIIIEKLLLDGDGGLPLDFKFYCFHGKCRFIRISQNRLGEQVFACYIDPDWNEIQVINPGTQYLTVPEKKPYDWNSILDICGRLSQPFDAVRVDMMICDQKLYFGEITHYDASGLAKYEPMEFDFEMGKYWNIEKKYWRKFK